VVDEFWDELLVENKKPRQPGGQGWRGFFYWL